MLFNTFVLPFSIEPWLQKNRSTLNKKSLSEDIYLFSFIQVYISLKWNLFSNIHKNHIIETFLKCILRQDIKKYLLFNTVL